MMHVLWTDWALFDVGEWFKWIMSCSNIDCSFFLMRLKETSTAVQWLWLCTKLLLWVELFLQSTDDMSRRATAHLSLVCARWLNWRFLHRESFFTCSYLGVLAFEALERHVWRVKFTIFFVNLGITKKNFIVWFCRSNVTNCPWFGINLLGPMMGIHLSANGIGLCLLHMVVLLPSALPYSHIDTPFYKVILGTESWFECLNSQQCWTPP